MYLHMCMRITKDTDARTSVVPSLPVPALHFAADDPFPLLYDWPPPTLIHQCRVCSQLGFARARDSVSSLWPRVANGQSLGHFTTERSLGRKRLGRFSVVEASRRAPFFANRLRQRRR